jgi:parallel beta helix pectate lyase-like protein
MSKVRFTLNILAVTVFTLMVASMAQAQATRTWVSGVGDDVNPCSRTAPCKTFAGAISKTATNGYINCIDPGGFGAVTITKSITIDGVGVMAGVLATLGSNGINVNDINNGPGTAVVVLRNLSIEGAGSGLNGINFTSGKSLSVESCVIKGFKNAAGNGIRASLAINGSQLLVRDTIISDNGLDGLTATTSSGSIRVICDNVHSNKNGASGFHTPNNAAITLVNCSASSNTLNGVFLENNTNASLNHCTVQSNLVDGLKSSATTHIADCLISFNFGTGVNVTGGNMFTYGDNQIRDNGANVAGALQTTQPKQ